MFIQIQWTCGSMEEAREVCRYLVENHHVACANIIPHVESIYIWQGECQCDNECKVMLKTKAEKWDYIKGVIMEKSSYDVPEILRFDIADGYDEYLQWIEGSVNI